MMENIMLQVRPVAGLIKTNFDEIEKQLAADMCQYDGIIFTEDTKTDAKKKVAELRKLKKSIEDSRKEVKAQWMEPYNQFEAKRLKERQTEIEQIYTEEIGDMADFLPLYRLQEDKWGNASTSIKSIRKSMSETIANTRAGKAAIEAMQSDAVPDALRKFQATLSLPDALAYINRYEAQKAEILRKEEERRHQEEERRHQEEMERVRKDERQRMAHEERIRKDAEEAVRAEIKSVDEENAAPLTAPNSHTAVYTVVGTDAELQEVEMAMTSLGLYFERKDV